MKVVEPCKMVHRFTEMCWVTSLTLDNIILIKFDYHNIYQLLYTIIIRITMLASCNVLTENNKSKVDQRNE